MNEPFHAVSVDFRDHPTLRHLDGLDFHTEGHSLKYIRLLVSDLLTFAVRAQMDALSKSSYATLPPDMMANEAVQSERDRIMFHVMDELEGLASLGPIGQRLKAIIRGYQPEGQNQSMFDAGTFHYVRKPGVAAKLAHHPSALVRGLAARIVELEAQ